MDTLIEEVAKAINGPWRMPPTESKFSLKELRDVRWGMLDNAGKGKRLIQAESVITFLDQTGVLRQKQD